MRTLENIAVWAALTFAALLVYVPLRLIGAVDDQEEFEEHD